MYVLCYLACTVTNENNLLLLLLNLYSFIDPSGQPYNVYKQES